jgi:hypothetical protein
VGFGVDTLRVVSMSVKIEKIHHMTRCPPLLDLSFTPPFKDNYLTEMGSSSEEGSYLRLIDLCITQL